MAYCGAMNVVLFAIPFHLGGQFEGASIALYSLELYCRQDSELCERVTFHIVDPHAPDDDEAILQQLLDLEPDVLGVSCYLWTRERSMAVVQRASAARPSMTVLAGGPDIGRVAERTLRSHPFVDAVCQWEGEEALRLLLRRTVGLDEGDWRDTPGWTVRKQGKEVANAPAPAVVLDEVPSIQEHPGYVARYPTLFIQTSRGCHYGCTFCLYNKTARSVRSLELIAREMDDWAAKGRRQIEFIDAGLNQFPDRFRGILGMLRDRPGLFSPFVELNVEMMKQEDAALVAATAARAAIGLQSADRQINKNVVRPYRQNRFRERVLWLKDAGLEYSFDLIYGLPGDTLDAYRATLDEAYSMDPVLVAPFCLQVLPGSTLEGEAKDKWGMRWQEEPWYWLHHSDTFPAADLQRAARIAQANDLLHTFTFRSTAFQQMLAITGVGAAAALESFIDGAWRGRAVADEELVLWSRADGLEPLRQAIRGWVEHVAAEGQVGPVLQAWEVQLAMARVVVRPMQPRERCTVPRLSPNAEVLHAPPMVVVMGEGGVYDLGVSDFLAAVLERCDGQRDIDAVLEPWRQERPTPAQWDELVGAVTGELRKLEGFGMVWWDGGEPGPLLPV